MDLGYDWLILHSAFPEPISRRAESAYADAVVHHPFPSDRDSGRALPAVVWVIYSRRDKRCAGWFAGEVVEAKDDTGTVSRPDCRQTFVEHIVCGVDPCGDDPAVRDGACLQ